VIHSESGKKFFGTAMVNWVFVLDVKLRLIEPGEPARTPISNRSMVASAMSASTNIGFPARYMRAPRLRPGAVKAMKSDPRTQWAC